MDSELPINLFVLISQIFEIVDILIMGIIYLSWFTIAIPFMIVVFFFLMTKGIFETTNRNVRGLVLVKRPLVVNKF